MSGPFGEDEEVLVEARFAGDYNDLYRLSWLRCDYCSAKWRQYRRSGQPLELLRCVQCNRRQVQFYEGEPSTNFMLLH